MHSMICISGRHERCDGITFQYGHVEACTCTCHHVIDTDTADEPNDSGVVSTVAVD